MSDVSVRYMIDDVPVAVKFYTTVLGFTLGAGRLARICRSCSGWRAAAAERGGQLW
jgi:hypothetical protein